MKTIRIIVVFMLIAFVFSFTQCGNADTKNKTPEKYKANWKSLSQWTVPEWFDNAVLGIYCHWGVYSVPGFRFDDGEEQVDSGIWYGWFMYVKNDDKQPNFGVYDFHRETYGDPMEFGYHDLVPLFTAKNWDPDRWAALYKYSGADFAGICAEHGDGFAMWNSEYDEFNAMDKGPERDILGEMFDAARKVGMKTVASFHEPPGEMFDAARDFYPKGIGANDPMLQDLYGTSSFEVLNKKLIEVVDKYLPDQMWFEDMYNGPRNWKNYLAYYYNAAESAGKQVLITQKHGEAPLSSSVLDIEGGIFAGGVWQWEGMTEPQEQRWQKDVPLGNYWAYAEGVGCRPVNMLVDGTVDRVSKNGVTLLSVAPTADGTLPEAQIHGLTELGDWMKINKEALYAAKPANFLEGGADIWSAGTFRYTEKDGYVYAIDLGNEWPSKVGFAEYRESKKPEVPVIIPGVTPAEGSEVLMLGSDTPLDWKLDGPDLVIESLPDSLPCDHAWTYKIKI
jgi:alpha-L-fucosidase